MPQHQKLAANTKNKYTVRRSDLPLSCPTAEMEVWNAHPKVYLPIDKTGEERCPYCGALFVLIDD